MTSVKVNSSIHFNLCVHGFINHKHLFLQPDWFAYVLTKDTKPVESDQTLPPRKLDKSEMEGQRLAHKYTVHIGKAKLTLLLGRGVALHLEGAGLTENWGASSCCFTW